jgi:hypothetical protein
MNTREVHSLLQTVSPIEQPALAVVWVEDGLLVLHLGKSENLRVQALKTVRTTTWTFTQFMNQKLPF